MENDMYVYMYNLIKIASHFDSNSYPFIVYFSAFKTIFNIYALILLT